jgi:hypothetical protein
MQVVETRRDASNEVDYVGVIRPARLEHIARLAFVLLEPGA